MEGETQVATSRGCDDVSFPKVSDYLARVKPWIAHADNGGARPISQERNDLRAHAADRVDELIRKPEVVFVAVRYIRPTPNGPQRHLYDPVANASTRSCCTSIGIAPAD